MNSTQVLEVLTEWDSDELFLAGEVELQEMLVDQAHAAAAAAAAGGSTSHCANQLHRDRVFAAEQSHKLRLAQDVLHWHRTLPTVLCTLRVLQARHSHLALPNVLCDVILSFLHPR